MTEGSRLASCRCNAHFGKSSLICTYVIHLCEICASCIFRQSQLRNDSQSVIKSLCENFWDPHNDLSLRKREKKSISQKISISKENKSFISRHICAYCNVQYFLTYEVIVCMKLEEARSLTIIVCALNKMARIKLSFSEYEFQLPLIKFKAANSVQRAQKKKQCCNTTSMLDQHLSVAEVSIRTRHTNEGEPRDYS